MYRIQIDFEVELLDDVDGHLRTPMRVSETFDCDFYMLDTIKTTAGAAETWTIIDSSGGIEKLMGVVAIADAATKFKLLDAGAGGSAGLMADTMLLHRSDGGSCGVSQLDVLQSSEVEDVDALQQVTVLFAGDEV